MKADMNIHYGTMFYWQKPRPLINTLIRTKKIVLLEIMILIRKLPNDGDNWSHRFNANYVCSFLVNQNLCWGFWNRRCWCKKLELGLSSYVTSKIKGLVTWTDSNPIYWKDFWCFQTDLHQKEAFYQIIRLSNSYATAIIFNFLTNVVYLLVLFSLRKNLNLSAD